MDQPKLEKIVDFKVPTAALALSSVDDSDQHYAIGCMDGVYLLNMGEQSFEKLDHHDSYVSSIAARQRTLISAGYDGKLQWFDLDRGERTRQLRMHEFWSWDMSLSPDQTKLASVTGQYLAGGYKYEPAPEREPSVKIIAADSGDVIHEFSHTPSVQAVAFSPDSRFVAAGNLMGQVRIWDIESGDLAADWTTPDFTSWGIIKSHCYLGGIFSLRFTEDGQHVLLAGMGPMRDPMAGNGRQLWQKWRWNQPHPAKVDETHKGESGEGLMEALAVAPGGERFAMGGRLRGGDWNVAIFDTESGDRLASLKTGYRVTDLSYSTDGSRLFVVGTQGQPGDMKNGVYPHFGRVEAYTVPA